MNTNKVLIWLKNFKSTWLPQTILNDTHLIELITNQLHELEQLLIQNTHDENEILIETEHQCAKSNSTEQRPLLTPSDTHNHIDNKKEQLHRPTIRLKRIPLAEAEHFLPSAWKIPKSKTGRKKGKKNSSTNYTHRKKNTQTNKLLSSTTQDESTAIDKSNVTRKSIRSKKPVHPPSTTAVTNIQSINDDRKKSKRKLRAIDGEDDDLYILGNLSQTDNPHGNNDCDQISRYIGQNGILSQIRKTNETTYDEDFTIKLHSRQCNQDQTILSNNINPLIMESSVSETGLLDEDIDPIDDEQMFQDIIENNDNESLFTSLDITHDKTLETNSILNNNSILDYNDCIEDITNDGIDLPPSSSSPNLNPLSLTT